MIKGPGLPPMVGTTPQAASMDGKIKKLKSAFEKVEEVHRQWRGIWQDCYDYALPNRVRFDGTVEGEDRTSQIFDTTAVEALSEFASRVKEGIAPPFSNWADFKAGREVPVASRPRLEKKLQEIQDYVFEIIAESNFDGQAEESFHELGIGTSVLLVEEGDYNNPIHHTAAALTEIKLERGPQGEVRGVWRDRMMAIEDILAIWPKGTLSANLMRCLKDSPKEKVRVLEALRRDIGNRFEMHYDHCVFTPDDEHEIFYQSMTGEGSSPWIVSRWSVAAGETYGRGPLLKILPTVRKINLVQQMVLENGELAIAGLWQADDDGVVNWDTVEILPGTVVPRTPGQAGLEALQPGSNFDVSQLLIETMQREIRDAMLDENYQGDGKTPVSAAEIFARRQRDARRRGGPAARLVHEFAIPYIRRVVHILKRQGKIEVPLFDGKEVKVKPNSSLARSRQLDEVADIDQYLELAQTRFGPESAAIIIDQMLAARKIASRMGIDADIVRSEEEVAKMVQKGQEMQQMADQGGAPGA